MKTLSLSRWLTSSCICLLLVFSSCSKDDVADVEQQDENQEIKEDVLGIAEEILQLVNRHRTGMGLNALLSNNLAIELANNHTLYMIDMSKISHDNFDERADRLFDENAKRVGENVAAKQKTANEVMEDWLESAGHRKNIEGDFTHIGISVIKNKAGQYYFTQLFLKL